MGLAASAEGEGEVGPLGVEMRAEGTGRLGPKGEGRMKEESGWIRQLLRNQETPRKMGKSNTYHCRNC